MMRKSTVVLIIVISSLMFYAGCNDDDGGGGGNTLLDNIHQGPPILPDGGLPPPEAGEGPPLSAACQKCICPFFNVPMSAECWPRNSDASDPFKFHFFKTQGQRNLYLCEVRDYSDAEIVDSGKPFIAMGVQICDINSCDPKGPLCYVIHNKTDCVIPGSISPGEVGGDVGGFFPRAGDLKTEDLEACVGCLEEYTFALRERLCMEAGCPSDVGIQIPQCAPLP